MTNDCKILLLPITDRPLLTTHRSLTSPDRDEACRETFAIGGTQAQVGLDNG
jgi:hypothetical protein